jgi:hypothetical protein
MSIQSSENCVGDVMVSMFASFLVDRGFDPRPDQTKYYEIDICCFSAKHAALMRKSKNWLSRNLELGDMYICGLFFQ